MHDEFEDNALYMAVVNHEEQYSVWPEHKPIPQGWREAGKRGMKREVLQWIGEVWGDMRPLSVRRRMEEFKQEHRRRTSDDTAT